MKRGRASPLRVVAGLASHDGMAARAAELLAWPIRSSSELSLHGQLRLKALIAKKVVAYSVCTRRYVYMCHRPTSDFPALRAQAMAKNTHA